MIKVVTIGPRYGLKKTFVRTNMVFEEDVLSIMRAIKKSEDDIKNGRVYDGKKILEELRKKYEYR